MSTASSSAQFGPAFQAWSQSHSVPNQFTPNPVQPGGAFDSEVNTGQPFQDWQGQTTYAPLVKGASGTYDKSMSFLSQGNQIPLPLGGSVGSEMRNLGSFAYKMEG